MSEKEKKMNGGEDFIELEEDLDIDEEILPEEKNTDEEVNELADIATELFSLPFSFMAARKKKKEIELNEEEKEQLRKVLIPLVKKYMPGEIKYMPEIIFVMYYYGLLRKKLSYAE